MVHRSFLYETSHFGPKAIPNPPATKVSNWPFWALNVDAVVRPGIPTIFCWDHGVTKYDYYQHLYDICRCNLFNQP